ncbi:CTLH/CRA C-terminal to lish motif domain-containing protein [Spinellus fusiger]|nr:CTLH/CRA C-terminal to lish motif domain-containing protein [Spinellus fusiger]
MTMNQTNPEQIIELELPFLKVPYEQLRKSFRNAYRYIEKELQALTGVIDGCIENASDGKLLPELAQLVLEDLIAQVSELTDKLQTIRKEEEEFIRRIQLRLDNLTMLSGIHSAKAPEFQTWSNTRLNRVLVDYLLRSGLTETAKRMASDNGIEAMVDTELFSHSEKIERSLKQRSCKECLLWCVENKSGLKKIKSTLEFNLRMQEFIELARASQGMEALLYARKYLVPWRATENKRVMQAMGLLPFRPTTQCQPYKDMYDISRWDQLVIQFKRENFALYSLTTHPLLFITLQVGLSALKSPQCYQHENRNVNCPVCDTETLGQLAEKLPLSHHLNSTIVCRMSGKIMNEDNPPMLLPNGRVYSLEALQDMGQKNHGSITCPRTGLVYQMKDLKKVFVS